MKTLIEDYKRRLATAEEMIETTKDTGSRNDIAKLARLNTKAGMYRTIISELEQAIQREKDEQEEKLTSNEKETRLDRLVRMNFADLKALEAECNEKMSSYQRRFPTPRGTHKNIYEEMFPLWQKWYSLRNAVQCAMNEQVENLHT